MNLALIGPPGAGKGTQAEILTRRFDLTHVSTGDLFIRNVQEQTALGLLARKYMLRGELVPDEVVDAMVEEFLLKRKSTSGILFDGFPRTRYQAEFLDELFAGMNLSLDAVIYLHISDEEAVRRLEKRQICRTCQVPFHPEFNPFKLCPRQQCSGEFLFHRRDDNAELVSQRLRIFHREVATLASYYRHANRLRGVDGEGSIDEVAERLAETIGLLQRRSSRMTPVPATPPLPAPPERLPALEEGDEEHGLHLVLLGAPGSGKGTQAERLQRELHLCHIATGDLFRENLKRETELGKVAKSYMDRGELVPNDVTESMVRERLAQSDTHNGTVLDGFPRTLSQAEALDEMLRELNRRLAGVIYIEVPDDEIVERLSGRLICRQCQVPFHRTYNPFTSCPQNTCNGEHLYRRHDDDPEIVRSRLKTFHRQTAPLIERYRAAGLLHRVNGSASVDEVAAEVLAHARSLRRQVRQR